MHLAKSGSTLTVSILVGEIVVAATAAGPAQAPAAADGAMASTLSRFLGPAPSQTTGTPHASAAVAAAHDAGLEVAEDAAGDKRFIAISDDRG